MEAPAENLPFLTCDIPPASGEIRAVPEDFRVDEIPRYRLCGEGDHVFLRIEKRNLPTLLALDRIAKTLGVARKAIGYAGLKDARAVTRQWISIEHLDTDRLIRLDDVPNLQVVEVTRHTNKLRIGHLAGNRFQICLRNFHEPLDTVARRARGVLDVLAVRGVPNYFGPQRFGNRSDTHLLGAAIIARQPQRFLDLFLGLPDPADRSEVFVARSLYEKGLYEKAADAWPRDSHDQKRALHSLVRTGGDHAKAFNLIDTHVKRFFISAFQSDLFNQVLAARMPDIDRLFDGDFAYKHDNGACFAVEDAAVEQPRCDRFEISPTGPLYGYRMTEAAGRPGEIENDILAPTGLQGADFRQMGYYRVKGARRPLRFQPRDIDIDSGHDERGVFLRLGFTLDPGCYATTLLREIVKSDDLR